ncbi:MAG: DNA primase [candidate division FCPU426 bacterium]
MNLPDDKERVRDATDIVAVVSQYVALKAAGRNLKGLCPFHGEKTPSFFVNPERQTFKCFGCGAGGDVFEFLMRREGWTFPETLKTLAERANITLTRTGGSQQPEREQLKRQLYAVMAWAAERFTQALRAPEAGKGARAYLQQRQIPEELWSQFGLGFAPPGRDNLLRAAQRDHYSQELLLQAGLLVEAGDQGSPYDRFRQRWMFPIFDLQGRPVAFGGRLLGDQGPKYLNSPETPLFRKGDLLYALNVAREAARSAGRLIVVEGYVDAIACHAAGLAETVASLGTALTPKQAQLIKRYANQAVLMYDADEAGIAATRRAFELLVQAGVSVKAVVLPEAKDPDEYWRRFGASALKERVDRAVSVVEYVLEKNLAAVDTRSLDGKLKVVRLIGPLIRLFPAGGIEEGEYAHLLAQRLQLLDRQVLTEISRLQTPAPLPKEQPAPEPVRARAALEEELIVATLLRYPWTIAGWRDKLRPEWFQVSEYRNLLEKILAEPFDPDQEDRWWPEARAALTTDLAELGERLLAVDRGTQDPERVLEDCVKRLELFRLQDRLTGIQIRIQEVEATGDWETLKQLQEEKRELAGQLKRFGPVWKGESWA